MSYLPKRLGSELGNTKKIAIAEIAGRDSVAAALNLIKERKVDEILPIADDVPPQYGNLNEAFNPIFWLQKEAEKYGAVWSQG